MQQHLPAQPDNTRSGGSARSALPPAYLHCAANLAKWFPEVLLLLGAPDLEDNYQPASVNITDDSNGRAMEVTLERWPCAVRKSSLGDRSPPATLPAPSAAHSTMMGQLAMPSTSHLAVSSSLGHTAGRDPVLERLERLASDYELLAAQLTGRVPPPVQARNARLEASIPSRPASSAPVAPQQERQLISNLDSLAHTIERVAASMNMAASGSSSTSLAPAMVPDANSASSSTCPAVASSTASRSAPPLAAPAQKETSVRPPPAVSAAPAPLKKAQEDEGTPRGRQVRQRDNDASNQRHAVRTGAACRTKVATGGARAQPQPAPVVPAPEAALEAAQSSGAEERKPNLKISIHKQESLEEPSSPKFVKQTRSWGATRDDSTFARPAKSTSEEVDTKAIKNRIEKKLIMLFGVENQEEDQKNQGKSDGKFFSV